FGWRTSPITGVRQHHNGMDSVAQDGNGSVREVTGGTVIEVSVGYNYGRGNLVRVQCGNAVETYQHLATTAVKKGQLLKQGDAIGVAGSTGDSTGTHLHFEVTIGGKAVNPSEWCGVPNAVGTYPGNDTLDIFEPGAPVQVTVGSVVQFAGGGVYGTSEAAKATVIQKAVKCVVTAIAEGAAHPYHCISQDKGGVYGWVDADSIGAADPAPVAMYQLSIGPMTKGDKDALVAQAQKLGVSVAVMEVG
ncbi:M23 family metallopeptidase, partial [Ruminococcaceae bacterium OttesenSCG-928-D13]|nr:M23 family metallopeptidase [Ruminococcaceae bacterium OttesenSCG-928-D13]